MANKANVERAIAVLSAPLPTGFNMSDWHCETAACFAGHLALSPDIPEMRLCEFSILPEYRDDWKLDPWEAVAVFLDIDPEHAATLCGLNATDDGISFYGKPLGEVTPADVIAKLRELLS